MRRSNWAKAKLPDAWTMEDAGEHVVDCDAQPLDQHVEDFLQEPAMKRPYRKGIAPADSPTP